MTKVMDPITINHDHAAVCLRLAEELLELIRSTGVAAVKAGEEDAIVTQDQFFAVVNRRFSTPLVDRRLRAIGVAIAQCVNHHGLTTCTLWDLAHLLDHSIYDENLDDLPE